MVKSDQSSVTVAETVAETVVKTLHFDNVGGVRGRRFLMIGGNSAHVSQRTGVSRNDVMANLTALVHACDREFQKSEVAGKKSDVWGMCNNTRTSIGVGQDEDAARNNTRTSMGGQRNGDRGTGGSHGDRESRTGRLHDADRKKERGKKGQEDVSDTTLPSTRHVFI
ncbi:hypothetical protein HBI96_095520 [Parastagonospora nodorum]|nr:hypothetical protein HBI96_095520 [Parastagonospora nodorum]